MDIDRKEAVDNLRVAIQATLLVVPQHEYRVWAQKYLQQTEPTVDMGLLADMATDSIAALHDWEPWLGPGRARQCWFIVDVIGTALGMFGNSDYHNATLFALDAAQSSLRISKASQEHLVRFVQDLEKSLHGEALTKG